jgi:hypothetical protein
MLLPPLTDVDTPEALLACARDPTATHTAEWVRAHLRGSIRA